MIQIQDLRKSFGKHLVLDGIDLDVAQGTIFALLGSNGAGKTTLVRILTTLLKPDSGTARVNGFDIVAQPLFEDDQPAGWQVDRLVRQT